MVLVKGKILVSKLRPYFSDLIHPFKQVSSPIEKQVTKSYLGS